MLPARIIKKLKVICPDAVVDKKQQYSYISGYLVTAILDDAFGCDWDWIIESEEIVSMQNKTVAFCKGYIEARYTDDFGNYRHIRKYGTGGQLIADKKGPEDSKKGASTDALKKAASYLGVASFLYLKPQEQAFLKTIGCGLGSSYNPLVDPYNTPFLLKIDEILSCNDNESVEKLLNKHGLSLLKLGESIINIYNTLIMNIESLPCDQEDVETPLSALLFDRKVARKVALEKKKEILLNKKNTIIETPKEIEKKEEPKKIDLGFTLNI